MSILSSFSRLLQEPPPEFAFEVSEAGIAYARPAAPQQVAFQPIEPETVVVSPLRDNVAQPEILTERVRSLIPKETRRRTAVLILPDYCSRVVSLDFNEFPTERDEQLALVKFRMKKSVPFDLESAAVSFQAQPSADNKRMQVLVAAVALEIVSRYEAVFRAAGLQPGLVTTSALAAADLMPAEGVNILAKLCDDTLTVSVVRNGQVMLVRCVELGEITHDEVMNVLFPTMAYVEDELETRPRQLFLCGFRTIGHNYSRLWAEELQVPIEELRSRLGAPGEHNAGLMGYLESLAA